MRDAFGYEWVMGDASEVDERNAFVSALEVARFRVERPERVFCYPARIGYDRHSSDVVTTWMVDPLGRIVHRGRKWRSNMGDERQAIRVLAITGDMYAGVVYGTYVRMRRVKTRK